MNDNTNPNIKTQLTIGLRRPNWVCANSHQDAILVRDASGSMDGDKARDASDASLALVADLAGPANKDGFSVAIVDFGDDARVVHGLTKATALNGSVTTLNANSGSTNITAGLEKALDIIEKAAAAPTPGITHLRTIVILFSDGGHNTGPDPVTVAARLKGKADIVTVAYGKDADEDGLKALATSDQHFYRCSNGAQLRQFLASVGNTIQATRRAGVNATQALTQLQ